MRMMLDHLAEYESTYLIEGRFAAAVPDQLWVADLT